jgi:hypothetical protein
MHRWEVRQALASALPSERKKPQRERPQAGTGARLYRRDSRNGPQGTAQAVAYRASHLDASA